MLVFAIFVAANDEAGRQRLDWLKTSAADLLPFRPSGFVEWRAARSPASVRVAVWLNDPAAPVDKYVVATDQGIRILQGWRIDDVEGELGEFLEIDIDASGDGGFRRSLSPVYPLYMASRDGVAIITNRKLFAATALAQATQPRLDDEFVACTIGCGWALGTNTLFEGVEVFATGAEPRLKKGGIIRVSPPDDPWHAPELAADFKRDPDAFWNRRIQELDRVADLFFTTDGQPRLGAFPLSSGKDSRLLFAILNRRDRFRDVTLSTHGAPYQHDVVVASAIANRYGMKHAVTDSVFQTIELAYVLPEHMFLTEGRSSPSDLLTWRASRQPGVQAIGHELGLRDVIDAAPGAFTVDATFAQVGKLLGYFDRLGVLRREVLQQLSEKFRRRVEAYYDTTGDPGNVAWRLYMENRVLHYVSLIKMKDEAQRDSPYALMTAPIVRAAYAVGLDARLQERVHFELLRRLDPWLTYDCPFGGQRWPLALRVAEGGAERFAQTFPTYASKRAPPKGTYAAYDANRHAFRDFVMDNLGKLDHIVDRARVEAALARPAWGAAEMGSLWYLVGYCGARGADWRLLAPSHRHKRPPYFPELRYSNMTGQHGSEAEALNAIYRDVLPAAVYAIAREEQGKELLRQADALWAMGKDGPAFNLYAAAAGLGEAQAYFALGRCYLNGTVVAKNADEALRLLELAKAKGVAAAASLLALCYANGAAVKKNEDQAIRLYEEAASMGDFWSLERVARLNETKGVESRPVWKRLEKALLDYTRDRANSHALYLLGVIYLEGRSGNRDAALGRSYLLKAKEQGSKLAADRLAADQKAEPSAGPPRSRDQGPAVPAA